MPLDGNVLSVIRKFISSTTPSGLVHDSIHLFCWLIPSHGNQAVQDFGMHTYIGGFPNTKTSMRVSSSYEMYNELPAIVHCIHEPCLAVRGVFRDEGKLNGGTSSRRAVLLSNFGGYCYMPLTDS